MLEPADLSGGVKRRRYRINGWLAATAQGHGTSPKLSRSEQDAAVERVVHTDELTVRDRAAAILVIVFGQHVEDVIRLTWDDVTVTVELVTIRLGKTELALPSPLDEPMRELAAAPGHDLTASHPTSHWVFRGYSPGRHIHGASLRGRLKTVFSTRAARLGTLHELKPSRRSGVSMRPLRDDLHRTGLAGRSTEMRALTCTVPAEGSAHGTLRICPTNVASNLGIASAARYSLWISMSSSQGGSMVTDDMPRHWYEDYERGRPGYPEQVVDLAELAPSATALELAAGTGKFTRQLVSRIAHVVAVEPDPGMRRLLVAGCPGVEAIDGAAEQIPLADDAVDAVFVAQAFHWFDNEPALMEFARVLRPGGALVVMWNVAKGSAVPSITAVEELLAPIWPRDSGFPLDMMSGDWAPGAWNLPFAEKAFNQIREARLANPQTVDPQGLVAFFGSMGWVANLPDEERQPLVDAMRSHLTAAEYVLPWQTRVQWTRLSTPT